MYFQKVRDYLKNLSDDDLLRYRGIVKTMFKEQGKNIRVGDNVNSFIRGARSLYFDEYLVAIDRMGSSSAIGVLSGKNYLSHWRDLILAATEHTVIPDNIAVHINDPTIAEEISALFQELIVVCSDMDQSKEQFRARMIRLRQSLSLAKELSQRSSSND